MSNPEPAGSAHPARAAGVALLGVAAVALVIGVVTLFTGGDDDDAAGAQPTDQPAITTSATQSEASTSPSGEPSSIEPSSSAAASSAQPTTSPASTTNSGQAAGTPNPPPPVTVPAPKPPVRVYNNSTVVGLAARASEDVKRLGWEVAEPGNYPQGQIPTTTVYYRPGTDEEASARLLAEALRARVEPRFDGITAAHAGIIMIVTNDYRGPSKS